MYQRPAVTLIFLATFNIFTALMSYQTRSSPRQQRDTDASARAIHFSLNNSIVHNTIHLIQSYENITRSSAIRLYFISYIAYII